MCWEISFFGGREGPLVCQNLHWYPVYFAELPTPPCGFACGLNEVRNEDHPISPEVARMGSSHDACDPLVTFNQCQHFVG